MKTKIGKVQAYFFQKHGHPYIIFLQEFDQITDNFFHQWLN